MRSELIAGKVHRRSEYKGCHPIVEYGEQNRRSPKAKSISDLIAASTGHEKADAAGLVVLIFEAILIDAAGSTTVSKDDDPLAEAAGLYKVDTKALHRAVVKAEQERVRIKAQTTRAEEKPAAKRKAAR